MDISIDQRLPVVDRRLPAADQRLPAANIDWKDTVAYIPQIQNGRVIKVYDGDTLTVAAYLSPEDDTLYRFPVRLRGIDAPEKRSSVATEKQAALVVQKALSEKVLHQIVVLTNLEHDKYGRLLANVATEECPCLSKWMLKEHFAVAYDGGKKVCPADWMKYLNK